jgi:hypothetical protein
MEKFRIPFGASLPAVELFLEDIYILKDIINKFSPEWHFETGDCKFDDIDDLKSNLGGQTLSVLAMTDAPTDPARPGFWVSIFPTQVGVDVWPANENDFLAAITFRHLEEFLLSKKRQVSAFTRYACLLWSGAFLSLVTLVGLRYWLGQYILASSYPVAANFFILLFFAVIWFLAASYLWWNRKKQNSSLIHMENNPEMPPLWERMDAWINVKGQVSNLLGQILKWILAVGGGATLLYLYEHWRELF